MIVRSCSQGHRIRIHRNTTQGATRVKTYTDGSTENMTYTSYDVYCVDVDVKIAKTSNSVKVAEES